MYIIVKFSYVSEIACKANGHKPGTFSLQPLCVYETSDWRFFNTYKSAHSTMIKMKLDAVIFESHDFSLETDNAMTLPEILVKRDRATVTGLVEVLRSA